MRLFSNCSGCKAPVTIRSMAVTRSDLERDKGEKFEVNCQKCGTRYMVHVNDVRARENKIIMIAGVCMAVIIGIVLWEFLGAISTMVIIIPGLIWQQQRNAVQAFNNYLIRRR